MYILASEISNYPDNWYPYVVDIPLNAANLLLDEGFLKEFDWLFEEGITGYKIDLSDEVNDTWKITVQYWSYEKCYEETEFYLVKISLVNSFGVHKEEM